MKQVDSPSYMELCLHMDEKVCPVYLRVPTLWDAVSKSWRGVLKTSDGKLIHAEGKNSFDLQNKFNVVMSKAFETHGEELMGMFKPLEYWEKK